MKQSIFFSAFFLPCLILAHYDGQDFLNDVYNAGGIIQGHFMWRDIESPLNVDLRCILSKPDLLHAAVHLVSDHIDQCRKLSNFDLICPVPYSSFPFAGALALHNKLPLIFVRRSPVIHDSQRIIEGRYTSGQKVLVFEDCVGSGMSMQHTITTLERAGLIITDIVSLFNYEHGAYEKYARQGIRVHSLSSLSDLIEMLSNHPNGSAEFIQQVRLFKDRTQYCFRAKAKGK